MLQSVSLFLFICLVAKPVSGSGNLWALLAAGSNEYYNYRHQVGNVFRAPYSVLRVVFTNGKVLSVITRTMSLYHYIIKCVLRRTYAMLIKYCTTMEFLMNGS